MGENMLSMSEQAEPGEIHVIGRSDGRNGPDPTGSAHVLQAGGIHRIGRVVPCHASAGRCRRRWPGS